MYLNCCQCCCTCKSDFSPKRSNFINCNTAQTSLNAEMKKINKDRKLFIKFSVCIFLFLTLIPTSEASYLDHIPAHHQTSYYTLLRKMRASGIMGTLRSPTPARPTTQEEPTLASGGCRSPESRRNCQETCQRMQEYCSSTCYSQSPPPCDRRQEERTREQLQCISGCLDPSAASYRQSPVKCPFAAEDANNEAAEEARDESPGVRTPNETEAGASPSVQAQLENITAAERCRRDGFADSAVCELEYNFPEEALRVFNTIRPALSLCDDREYARRRPTRSRNLLRNLRSGNLPPTQESTGRPDVETTTPTNLRKNGVQPRQKRSPKFAHRIKRQAPSPSGLPNLEIEVCPTRREVSQPVKATHAKSGDQVDLYFYGIRSRVRPVYVQRFEVGGCKHNTPIVDVRVAGNLTPVCRQSMAQHLAEIYVNATQVNMSLYNRCQRISNGTMFMCRDWVFLPSHCKLYTIRT